MCCKKQKFGVQEANSPNSLKKNLTFKYSLNVEMSLEEGKK